MCFNLCEGIDENVRIYKYRFYVGDWLGERGGSINILVGSSSDHAPIMLVLEDHAWATDQQLRISEHVLLDESLAVPIAYWEALGDNYGVKWRGLCLKLGKEGVLEPLQLLIWGFQRDALRTHSAFSLTQVRLSIWN